MSRKIILIIIFLLLLFIISFYFRSNLNIEEANLNILQQQSPVPSSMPKPSPTNLLAPTTSIFISPTSILVLKSTPDTTAPTSTPTLTLSPSLTLKLSANWIVYTNKQLNYLIKYPDNWELSPIGLTTEVKNPQVDIQMVSIISKEGLGLLEIKNLNREPDCFKGSSNTANASDCRSSEYKTTSGLIGKQYTYGYTKHLPDLYVFKFDSYYIWINVNRLIPSNDIINNEMISTFSKLK